MTKKLIPFSQEYKSKLVKLIDIYKEGATVDITVVSFFGIFCMIISLLIIYAKSNLWYIFPLLLIPAILAIIYTIWDFKRQTFELRSDLKKLKKFVVMDVISDKSTRTYGWTTYGGGFKYNTIVKSFEYYIKTENHVYLTKDKELFNKLEIYDSVSLEIAEKSKVVLNIK